MDGLIIGVPAHHVVVAVEIPVTNEFSSIRIFGRFDKFVVDMNHGRRAPHLPQL
jgi:hypothetical protein